MFPGMYIHLTGYSQHVADLTLSGSELSKQFRDSTGFDASSQQLVQFARSSSNLQQSASPLMKLCGGRKSHWYQFRSYWMRVGTEPKTGSQLHQRHTLRSVHQP